MIAIGVEGADQGDGTISPPRGTWDVLTHKPSHTPSAAVSTKADAPYHVE
jgi:hypothetical protein